MVMERIVIRDVVVTVPGDPLLEGVAMLEGGNTFVGTQVMEVADPVDPDDAANKRYVDQMGLDNALWADITIHCRDTDGVYPLGEIDPIDDTATFVSEGCLEWFHIPDVPEGETIRVGINNMLNRSTSGVYDWDGTTFTRSNDAQTTDSIHGRILLSKIWHHHLSGAPFANGPQPLVAMMVADDPTDPIGEALWTGRPMVDFDSLSLFTSFLGWSDPILPAASPTPAWVDTTPFAGAEGVALSVGRDGRGNVEWRGWTVYTTDGPPDPEADPPPLTGSGFYEVATGLPAWMRPTAPTVLPATSSNFFTGNIPGAALAIVYPDGSLYVKPAAEGDHLLHINGRYWATE